MDKIPSFIRMNMVNIDSSELKFYLLKSAEQITQKLEKSVFELIFTKNADIQNELDKIISIATSKITSSESLVYIEN